MIDLGQRGLYLMEVPQLKDLNPRSDDFYLEYIEPQLKRVRRLAKRGCNKTEIAKRIHISRGTFYHHYRTRPELREAFMEGFTQNADKVANSLIKSATGYWYEEVETIKDEFGDVTQTKIKRKYQPPNQGAVTRVLGTIEKYYNGTEWLKEAQIKNLEADLKIKEQAIKALEDDNAAAIPLVDVLRGLKNGS